MASTLVDRAIKRAQSSEASAIRCHQGAELAVSEAIRRFGYDNARELFDRLFQEAAADRQDFIELLRASKVGIRRK